MRWFRTFLHMEEDPIEKLFLHARIVENPKMSKHKEYLAWQKRNMITIKYFMKAFGETKGLWYQFIMLEHRYYYNMVHMYGDNFKSTPNLKLEVDKADSPHNPTIHVEDYAKGWGATDRSMTYFYFICPERVVVYNSAKCSDCHYLCCQTCGSAGTIGFEDKKMFIGIHYPWCNGEPIISFFKEQNARAAGLIVRGETDEIEEKKPCTEGEIDLNASE